MNTNQYWRHLNWQREKISRRLKGTIYSRLYRNPNQDPGKSVLIAGTARSGTTWLADMVSAGLQGRILFEPFNPRLVKGYSQFNYFQYIRPDEDNEALEGYCRQIFSGTIRHPWIDRQVEYLDAEYRVVKAIRANLMLKWIRGHFPESLIIFIIRHPCAVVLSRLQLGWDTDGDIEPLVAQPKLVSDFLDPYMDIIARAETEVEKHAIIWCISNLVPLQQFSKDKLYIVFYEHLITRPEQEITNIFQSIGLDSKKGTVTDLQRPSTTSLSTSAIVTGEDRLTHWKNNLSPTQIAQITTSVTAFGLDYLYGDSIYPLTH